MYHILLVLWDSTGMWWGWLCPVAQPGVEARGAGVHFLPLITGGTWPSCVITEDQKNPGFTPSGLVAGFSSFKGHTWHDAHAISYGSCYAKTSVCMTTSLKHEHCHPHHDIHPLYTSPLPGVTWEA